MTTTTIGPAPSWRLIHDGTTVLMLAELSGVTQTIRTAFEAATQRECVAEARRLGLVVPEEFAELFDVASVPASVTRRQAKQSLLLNGLLANVQPAIDAIPDATQRAMIQIEWDDSQVFERDRPALIALGSALGLSAAQLDALFIQAAQL